MDKIILASNSPRRREILARAGIPFDMMPSDIDETLCKETSPLNLVMELSRLKARNVAENAKDFIIIAADTVVFIDSLILGKPKDEDDAFYMLKRLLGRKHTVITGVTLKKNSAEKTFAETADVYMKPASDGDIRAYIKTGEPMDKAGAYAIQGVGSIFIEKIDGDFYNVMGLPVSRVYWELREMGVRFGGI